VRYHFVELDDEQRPECDSRRHSMQWTARPSNPANAKMGRQLENGQADQPCRLACGVAGHIAYDHGKWPQAVRPIELDESAPAGRRSQKAEGRRQWEYGDLLGRVLITRSFLYFAFRLPVERISATPDDSETCKEPVEPEWIAHA
jgi:hypothetical protein